jgi:hypothetical protein
MVNYQYLNNFTAWKVNDVRFPLDLAAITSDVIHIYTQDLEPVSIEKKDLSILFFILYKKYKQFYFLLRLIPVIKNCFSVSSNLSILSLVIKLQNILHWNHIFIMLS